MGENNCYLQVYCKCIFILSTEIHNAILFTVEQKRVIAGWTELLLLSSPPSWTADPSSLTLLRGQRVGSLGLSPCWQLLMLCEMPPRRPSLTEPSSTLSFKGSVTVVCIIVFHLVLAAFFNFTANVVWTFFGSRKPLTTLAVRGWCMICRTIGSLWIWTMFTQCWRSDRCVLWTLSVLMYQPAKTSSI